MKYNKIFIVGGIGSGKTTLANKLSNILHIKTYELDDIAYKKRETYEKYKPKERNKKVKVILEKKKWIIEGFYSRSWIYPIYRKADVVIILNIKPSISKKRVILRFLKRKFFSKRKASLKKTIGLLKYVEEYPKKYFKIQKETAKKLSKRMIILKNNSEIREFLEKLK